MAKFSVRKFLTTVIVVACVSDFQVHCVHLALGGLYDIVIAVNEKTAQNSNEEYLENLKAGVQDLSDAIYESTRGKFSIRNADIVLPNHWLTEADGFVTTQSYKNADIRISHEYTVPQAINPTFCGYPGRYIELPYNFFDERDNGTYGLTGKALLTLWARYRWGIYEEHGYPGDPIFPYYYKNWTAWGNGEPEGLPEPWRVTSCSDAEIKGEYKTPAGGECDLPPPEVTEDPYSTTLETGDPDGTTTLQSNALFDSSDSTTFETTEITTTLEPEDPGLYPPGSDCRFYPEIYNQTARTSLMSFHMIQSLTDFCDSSTHDKRAPNRQNLFCQFKSAWEVISQSKDRKKWLKDGQQDRQRINYRILKKTDKPLLFILSEGVNMPPETVISTMVSRLNETFEKTEHWNVLAGAGVFPGKKAVDSFDTVYNWNTPWHHKDDLLKSFTESFGSREANTFRNFGAAIQDIGNHIRDRDHKPGAVVVVIKYGTEEEYEMSRQWPAYEYEVIGTILDQNIRLLVLEGEDVLADINPDAPFRLKNIAELSGGLHFKIGGEEDEENVNAVMTEVDNILTSGQVPRSKFRLAYKNAGVYPAESYKAHVVMPVNYKDVSSVIIYFHSESDPFILESVFLTGGPPQGGPFDDYFDEHFNWGRYDFDFKMYSILRNMSDDPVTEPADWKLTFDCRFSECRGMVVVIVELASEPEEEQEISLEVFTSVEEDDNVANVGIESVTNLKGVSFTVYAKLEKNGHPINGPDLEVIGHICHYVDGRVYGLPSDALVTCRQIILKDNGPFQGAPDLNGNDGIFSGSYIPFVGDSREFGGTYQVFATARIVKADGSKNVRTGPLPVKQDQIRCGGSGYQGCLTETVTEPFFLVADLKRRIEFIGIDEYDLREMGAANRILDLRISEHPVEPNSYNIEWTESGILGQDHQMGRVEKYEIWFANKFEDLINEIFRDMVYSSPDPIEAGRTARVTVNDLVPGEKRWYWMRSNAKENSPKAVWSNVVFVKADPAFFQTTTTTTTTTTPGPTSSTTRLTTKDPVTTGLPTKPTTQAITTTKATTTRITTRETTTRSTTTTPKPTTAKIVTTTEKIQRWYKSTEAIVIFCVFGVAMVSILAGVEVYLKFINRE